MPARTPFELDLIEQLEAHGEVTLPVAAKMAPSREKLWSVLSSMCRARTAALWSGERRLDDWEVDRLARARLTGSGEQVPADDDLVVRSSEASSGG